MVSNKNAAEYGWRDFRDALRLKWRLILLVGSLFLLGGGFLNWKRQPLFESVARVAIQAPTDGSASIRAVTEMRPSTLNEVRRGIATLRSGELLLRVAEHCELEKAWGISDPALLLHSLRSLIEVSQEDASNALAIVVRSSSCEKSAELVNAIANEFVKAEERRARHIAEDHVRQLAAEIRNRQNAADLKERRLRAISGRAENSSVTEAGEVRDLRRELVAVKHVIRSLEAKHQLGIVELQQVSGNAVLLQEALPEEAGVLDLRKANMALFGLLGIAIGTVVIGLLSIRESFVQVIDRVSEELDLDLVGMVATAPLSAARSREQMDAIIEPYRELRLKIHRLPAGDCNLLAILTDEEPSATSVVAANLASVMADAGHTVLLIDGDLRNPALHNHFEAARRPGLADYLTGEMRLEETVVKTRKANLWLMPGGPTPHDPSSLLSGKRMEDLVWEMKSRFDYILIVAPSLLQFADASTLVGYSDHNLVVTTGRHHSLARLRKTKKAIESVGASLSGILLGQAISDLPMPVPAIPSPNAAPQERTPPREPVEKKTQAPSPSPALSEPQRPDELLRDENESEVSVAIVGELTSRIQLGQSGRMRSEA